MDIFKFNNPTHRLKMEHGEIINNLKSKMWIERYNDLGEFTFVCNASSGAREMLPRGTFVSHVDTTEIMVVEDHQISDQSGKETEVIITGRSFEKILEERVIGLDVSFPKTTSVKLYTVSSGYPQNQLRDLIINHVQLTVDDDDELDYVYTLTTVPTAGYSVIPSHQIEIMTLYEKVKEMCAVNDFGFRAIRPGPWHDVAVPDDNVGLYIFKPEDLSGSVVFSYDSGEIESADYLWSDRSDRNCIVVVGKWVAVRVQTADVGYDRRILYLDGTSFDEEFSAAPAGGALTTVIDNMTKMANEALLANNETVMAKPEISKSGVRSVYRQDYGLGDIIMVNGDYDSALPMRVTEYVEIEDKDGRHGYPTLSVVNS